MRAHARIRYSEAEASHSDSYSGLMGSLWEKNHVALLELSLLSIARIALVSESSRRAAFELVEEELSRCTGPRAPRLACSLEAADNRIDSVF